MPYGATALVNYMDAATVARLQGAGDCMETAGNQRWTGGGSVRMCIWGVGGHNQLHLVPIDQLVASFSSIRFCPSFTSSR